MTQEEKELLFRDLSARIIYGLKCYPVITNGKPNIIGGYRKVLDDLYVEVVGKWFPISMIKPYLRPRSSMTEDERNEYFNIIKNTIDFYNCPKSEDICFLIIPIDWLNAHHFDYRNLIGKGLALEAPEGMYDTKY